MARKPLIAPGSLLPSKEENGDVMSRILARDREKRQAEDHGPYSSPLSAPLSSPRTMPEEVNLTGSTEDNITGNTESNIIENTEKKKSDNTTSNTAKNITRSKKPQADQDSIAEPGSIAEQIRRSLLRSAAPAPLKVITLKLPPELDQKIEEHCGRFNRKKQDVLRDAVLLYFEMLEQPDAERSVLK